MEPVVYLSMRVSPWYTAVEITKFLILVAPEHKHLVLECMRQKKNLNIHVVTAQQPSHWHYHNTFYYKTTKVITSHHMIKSQGHMTYIYKSLCCKTDCVASVVLATFNVWLFLLSIGHVYNVGQGKVKVIQWYTALFTALYMPTFCLCRASSKACSTEKKPNTGETSMYKVW